MRLDRWFHRRFPEVCRNPISTRSCARARCASPASARKSRPGSKPARACACRRSISPPTPRREAPRPPIRATPAAIRAMILFEDRDVMVLNKPYGLAVQGGSGTKRHIDGMLAALADKQRRAAGAGASARSRHVGRAAAGQIAQDRRRSRRDLPLARREENLLGAGRRRAEAGAGAHLAVSRQGRGDGRRSRRGQGQPRRHRAHARRPPWRARRAAFADALRGGRQSARRGSPGCRCARSPAAPINCAPIARRSAIRSSATPNTTVAPPTIPPAPIRCAPCRPASSPNCICWRAG